MTLRYETIDPKILRPNPWNSNIVSPENERKLDESLKRLGVFKPILVRQVEVIEEVFCFEILGGEHRVAAAVRLGMTEVPCIVLEGIDEKRAKEISLADNSRYGVDDTLSLAELLKGLGDPEQISTFLPWTNTDINAMLSSVTVDLDELSLTENLVADADKESGSTRTPKTHAIMRFKVPLGDHEKIAAIIARTQKQHGFTAADDLTNAGDALVHLLLQDRED